MDILCPACQKPIAVNTLSWETDEGLSQDDATRDPLKTISSVICSNCGMVQLPDFAPYARTLVHDREDDRDRHIAHFDLVRLLGQGSFGSVWLAMDTLLGRHVALKVPVSLGDEAQSLMHEAQTAATLRHPNIVSIYEVGTDRGQIFIASEYIDGLNLQDLLSSGTPQLSRTIELIMPVAQALHHAHGHGIVHRDVKPGNILINSQGQPYVTDFGLAKRLSDIESISSEGLVLGTARYMSPEQARGESNQTDHRADIYAIGVILFEMLTGHTPYRGNIRAVLQQKVVEDAPSPRLLTPSVPRDIETICLKCLERDPAKRYQTAEEVSQELRRFQQREPIRARPISSLERAWRWCRRRPAISGLVAGLILSLSAGLIGVSAYYREAQQTSAKLRQSLYRAQMNLASEFGWKGDVQGLRGTLDRIADDPEMQSLRGFEWSYFDTLLRPFVCEVNQGSDVIDVAISRDGDIVAACGSDQQLSVWEVATGKLLQKVKLDTGQFRAIDFAPHSNLLAAVSSDGLVRIYNPMTSEVPLHQWKHGGQPHFVQFAPDDRTVLTAGTTGAVRIREPDRESSTIELPSGQGETVGVRFSPSGDRVIVAKQSGDDGLIRVLSADGSGALPPLQPSPGLRSLAVSDDGRSIATGSLGGMLRLWSLEEGILDHSDRLLWTIGDLDFVHNTNLLAIPAGNGQLLMYDTNLRHIIRELPSHFLRFGVLAQSANGKRLAVGSGDGTVKVLRIEDLLTPEILWHEDSVRDVAYLSDQAQLAALSNDGELRIWDTATGQSALLTSVPDAGRPLLEAAGGRIAACRVSTPAGSPSTITIWDQSTRTLAREIVVATDGIAEVALAPDGRQLAVATQDGTILLYDLTSTANPRELMLTGSPVTCLLYSSDGRELLAGGEDGTVQLIDAVRGVPRTDRLQFSDTPRSLALCEGGRLLAVGTDMGEIHLWDLASQQSRAVIKGHGGRVTALAVLPNGTTLVSAGRDYALRLWDTRSAEPMTALFGHDKQVFALTISPEGDTIASGGLEGDIRLWRSGRKRQP